MHAQRRAIQARQDQELRSTWREHIAKAAQSPELKRQLSEPERQLLTRFAAYYVEVKTLPRRTRRSLQRQWKRSLAGLALLLALGQAPALAATINVGGPCKLVDAITAANLDEAIGGCTVGIGADTLVLPPGSTQTLTTVNNSTYGVTGLPVITSVITIEGNGSKIIRASGAPGFRIFAVATAGNLTLRRTTVSGGVAASPFPDNVGGGIINAGALTLQNSTLTGNVATAGGGLHNRAGACTLINSTVSNNDGSYGGGGVDNFSSSTLNVTNSTISDNSGTRGGGVLNRSNSTFALTNSTLSANTGGFFGGIANVGSSTLVLNDSTISGNTAASGGGITNIDSILTLNRTLIAGNIAAVGSEIRIINGTITAGNFNLFGHSGLTNAQAFTDFIPGASDLTATSDGNTPTALAAILNTHLLNNGGPTQTYALAASSPAIDVITDGLCPPPATDQRGVLRPQDGDKDGAPICDIGAFERVPAGVVTCDGLPATKVGTAAGETLNGTAGTDVINGLGGNDVTRGLQGNDVLCGGSGNDSMVGGAGTDRLFGGLGADRLDGGLNFDSCNAGPPTSGDTAVGCEQVTRAP